MGDEPKPFRYLTQEEFLRMSEAERLAYLQRVADHLAMRTAAMTPPEKKT